jgi:beta-lactamase class A
VPGLVKRVVPKTVVVHPPKRWVVVGVDGPRRLRPTSAQRQPSGSNAKTRRARKPVTTWRARGKFFAALPVVGLALVAFAASALAIRLTTSPQDSAIHADAAVITSKPVVAAAAPSLAEEQTSLQQALNDFVGAHTEAQFNIVAKDLHTGAVASVNPDRSYLSASLYKLFVADQIYHMIDTGDLTYGSSAGGGSNTTIRGCLGRMISASDSICGMALGDILNWGAQNPALAAQGFTETDLTTPQQTSARDVAALFEKLYDNTLDSSASNSAFLALLKSQEIDDRLPQGLPAGTIIAHKTGNLDNMVHDAGLIYGPKTDYLVVVMSGPWTQPADAPAQFAALSQELWRFFEQ